MRLITEDELQEFERLCDRQGMSVEERRQIIHDVFGRHEGELYAARVRRNADRERQTSIGAQKCLAFAPVRTKPQ